MCLVILIMNVQDGKDFYNKWKDIIGENTYCQRLYEEKIKKTSSTFTTDFDFDDLDDIMYNVVKNDQYKCLCLLLIQTKTTITKLANSFYDEEGNFIDDYSNIKFEELEEYILKLGGSPFKVKSFSFTQYNNEIEILEQQFKLNIKKLKKEQQELYLENKFLNSHKEDIRQMIKEIIMEEKSKQRKTKEKPIIQCKCLFCK